MLSLKNIFYLIVGILSGAVLSYFVITSSIVSLVTPQDRRQNGISSWVNPLLECYPEYLQDTPRIRQLHKKVNDRLDQFKSSHPDTSVSIYYKQLNTGAWFSYNPEEEFAAASLSKVPLIATIYKMAENNPQLFQRSFVFNPEKLKLSGVEANVESEKSLVQGKSYTVDELMKRMIIYSDNMSTVMLVDHLKINLANMFKDFGIIFNRTEGLIYLKAKSYAAVFRILYNSTFLSQVDSENILKLLSESDFNHGLKLHLPQKVRVAHKYGARHPNKTGYYQLHDCGIIYSQEPYLLCVMTRGKKLSPLSRIIAETSKIIFESVEK